MPLGASSTEEVAMDTMTMGASWPWNFDRLVLETGERSQATFVEQLGGELGDLRMEPPRLLQEEARIGRDGRGASEQVLQRRDRGSVWMGSLDRLLELAGITEKED